LTIRRKAAGSRPNLCPSAYVTTLHGISIAVWSELTTFAGAGPTGTGCPKTPLQPSPQDLDMAQANFDFLTAHNVLMAAPKITLAEEPERRQALDPESERLLLAVGKQPLNDVLMIIQDTGLRPSEVCRIRIENIELEKRRIFNPSGKTKASRRYVPISERMCDMLLLRCAGRSEGWLFPAARAESGHRTTVAKQFREARQQAGLPDSLVLYCARHAFGTTIYEETGNLAMVMRVMGHTDVRTSMRYQHPILDPVRKAIDQRNSRHNPRHSEVSVQ
jgi:integrase